MVVCLIGSILDAFISSILDNGDDDVDIIEIPYGMSEDEYFAWVMGWKAEIVEIIMPEGMPFQTALTIAESIYNNNKDNPNLMFEEAHLVKRVLDKEGHYTVSQAERDNVQLKYSNIDSDIDDKVETKEPTIYDPIDPSEDGDNERDSFSFETEIENMFGVEQMAISEEDIQSESDIRDPSSVDPIDQITQDEEVEVGDTTTTPESEISQIEETFFQEAVIYPNIGDYDLDSTDDAEEIFIPEQEYLPEQEIEARIAYMEEVIDDAQEQLNANTFESMAMTFHQDDSDTVQLTDHFFAPDDIDNSLVIDFNSLTDDVGGLATDLIADTFNDPFFEWIESPGVESLDIDPHRPT